MDSGWAAVAVSGVTSLVVVAGSHFVMAERVRRLREDIGSKIDRAEFEQAMKRLDQLHADLGSIRDLLLTLIRKAP